MSESLNFFSPVIEETETVTTTETSVTETVTTTTMVTETVTATTEETGEVRMVEEHRTTLEISPNFTKPLLPTTEVEEGGTVKYVSLCYTID
jgi:hypothetical protein